MQGFIYGGVGAIEPSRYQVLKDLSNFDQGESKLVKLLLPNGLKVFLCSDPELLESSGAVSVEVGSWNDPAEHPGMAHFVEHLLFLGTKEFPSESEYMQYIHERGGECNASTLRDRTVYGFSIKKNEDLYGVLDRFSHFFIDPLFSKSAIDREVYAVHHEFEDSIEDEFARIWRVFKETGNLSHPNTNFSCGNLESLQQLTQKDIQNWFERYYRPNAMCFVFLSPLPMEELIELSTFFFSRIPIRENLGNQTYQGSLSSPSQRESLIHLDATFNQRTMSLLWEISPVAFGSKENFAFKLLERVLSHGYINSLTKILEKEGLATAVGANFWKVEREHGIFKITVDLTRKGVRNYEKVIRRCFEVLAFLRKNPIPDYLIFKEQDSKRKCFFRGHQCAMQIAKDLIDENLQVYPDISSLNLLESISQVFTILQELTPEHCLYFLVSPFKETGAIGSSLEKWMGTKYRVRQIPRAKILHWSSLDPHPHFDFQPMQEDKASLSVDEVISVPEPFFVLDNQIARIRLVESSQRGNNIEAFFCLSMKDLGGSLRNEALYKFFIGTVEEALTQEFKEEEIDWKISIEKYQLCILLFSKVELLKEHSLRFFSALKEHKASKLQFSKVKKELLSRYGGDPDPLGYARQIVDSYLTLAEFTQMEIYQEMMSVSYEDYKRFQKEQFKELFVEGAFLGQISPEEVLGICQAIYEKIPFSSYSPLYQESRVHDFSKEVLLSCKTHRRGHALLSFVSSGYSLDEGFAASQIISVVMQNAFFRELRTCQQTAYKLYSWNEVIEDQICYGFALQSSTHCPKDLLERVEVFLDDFAENNQEFFSLEQMELIRSSLLIDLQHERAVTRKEGTARKLKRNIDQLEKITFQEVSTSMQKIFSKKNRKRISVLIEGVGSLVPSRR